MAPGMIVDGLMMSFRTTRATFGALAVVQFLIYAAMRAPAGIAIAAAAQIYGRNVTGE